MDPEGGLHRARCMQRLAEVLPCQHISDWIVGAERELLVGHGGDDLVPSSFGCMQPNPCCGHAPWHWQRVASETFTARVGCTAAATAGESVPFEVTKGEKVGGQQLIDMSCQHSTEREKRE
jgi:hypothetical protein